MTFQIKLKYISKRSRLQLSNLMNLELSLQDVCSLYVAPILFRGGQFLQVLTYQGFVNPEATIKQHNQIFTNSTFIPPIWVLSHSSLEQDPVP